MQVDKWSITALEHWISSWPDVQVVMTYAALTAVLLGAFWAAPNVGWIQWIIVAAVGFALYGPQMLIGLCGAEVVPKPAVSAAQGFLGWISYLGEHYPAQIDTTHGPCMGVLGVSSHGMEGSQPFDRRDGIPPLMGAALLPQTNCAGGSLCDFPMPGCALLQHQCRVYFVF